MKRSKPTLYKLPSSIKVYFYVYSEIQKGSCPSDICTKLNLSKQALYKYTKVLKANGYIEKIGYGVWKTSKLLDLNTPPPILTKFTSTYIKNPPINLKRVPLKSVTRSHAFIYSLKLPKIANWHNREIFFKKNNIEYSTFKNRNTQKLTFRNYKIQISNTSIVVYQPKFKSYFSESAKTGFNYAIYDFQQLITGLENLFKVSFRINKQYVFRVARQHHALIHNELAKMYNRENKPLNVRDLNGTWLIIDNSDLDNLNLNELEGVRNTTAINDIDKVIAPFFNSLRENPVTINQLLTMIGSVTANQDAFGKNLISHIEAVREIGKGAKELGIAVKELTKKIEKR
jgi:hypothetical protein